MAGLTQDLETALDQAARLVAGSNYLVALAGAGLSVESGIPPYRGPGGLWTKFGEPTMLSYPDFMRDPGAWWQTRLKDESQPGNPVYEMKAALDQAQPNPGHYALVGLETRGLLKQTLTQNVDNLHRRAGSRNLLEIHGNRAWLRCIQCGYRTLRDDFTIGPLPPSCPQCGGIIKSDTVMFGEPIPSDVLQACVGQVERCDCMLLVGTSGTVNPAAQLPLMARQRGSRLIEINPSETTLTSHCDLALAGASGELLPLLVERVQEITSQK